MKKINEIIKNNLLGLLIVVVTFGIVLLSLLIVSSDKYEDEISNLRVENKKLNNENKKLNNENKELTNENKELNYQITEQINAIDSLLENNKTECDCGVQEYEKGYIIDGYYYELKEQVGEE